MTTTSWSLPYSDDDDEDLDDAPVATVAGPIIRTQIYRCTGRDTLGHQFDAVVCAESIVFALRILRDEINRTHPGRKMEWMITWDDYLTNRQRVGYSRLVMGKWA